VDSNSVSLGEFVLFHEKFCSISSIIFMCCLLVCFLLLHHNKKKTKRFDDSIVLSELCTVDSHNELSFSLIVFIYVLFVGGFLDSLGAVCGGWDNYWGWDG